MLYSRVLGVRQRRPPDCWVAIWSPSPQSRSKRHDMNLSEARQIAALLNERNQLAGVYTDKSILNCAETYDYEIVDGEVASCVQRKELQWYQWEILHLSTSEKHE